MDEYFGYVGRKSGERERAMKKRKGRRHRRKGIQQRLLLLLVVSVLFFFCLLVDCSQKGLFSIKRIKEIVLQPHDERQETEEKKVDQKEIRVMITNDAMTEIFHDEIVISSDSSFFVKRDGKEKSYPAGERVKMSPEQVKKQGGKWTFLVPKGRLKVTSITRRGQVPSYRGELVVKWSRKGLVLINRLSLKEYLYGVLPGEMSVDYPLEALKAQAVCARSFAWQQMKGDTYDKYGADVDDTTSFQVYNMAPEGEKCRKAVNQTEGQMLYYRNHVITAYYYSTSWGSSATLKEVWGGDTNLACYPRMLQITDEDLEATGISDMDLSREEAVEKLLTETPFDCYDSDSPWYRWEYSVSADSLGSSLGVGTVKKIRVLCREKSGIVTRIQVTGSLGRVTLEGQQKIREGLYGAGGSVERQDGSSVSVSMLPSAAFICRSGNRDGKRYIYFTGGGFGHGVGMSQSGAAGMAKAGMDYQEILKHYYHASVKNEKS